MANLRETVIAGTELHLSEWGRIAARVLETYGEGPYFFRQDTGEKDLRGLPIIQARIGPAEKGMVCRFSSEFFVTSDGLTLT